MESLNTTLLNEILAFKIGSDDDALTFTDRLCRENNWSPAYAERCVSEYKKFVYLAITSTRSVTPSDQVDQVWHLHLTYTKSYWVELCQGVLKKSLHHGPTQGGKSESKKYWHQYQSTLDRYAQVFNESPPLEVWPECEQRFHQADKFVRLNTASYLLLKKPSRSLLAVTPLPMLLAACVKGDGSSAWFAIILLIAIVGLGYLLFKAVDQKKNGSSSGCGGGSGGTNNDVDGGDSGCGSGCGGCGG